MKTTTTQTATSTCSESIDDGRTYCTAPVTATVSWPDPTSGDMAIRIRPDGRYEYIVTNVTNVVRNVCGQCADWLMGMGASHLNPTRVDL